MPVSEIINNPTPILATAVIPWTENFEFDEDRFRHQVQTIAEGLTKHIYIFGTAGEGYAVTETQFDQIAQSFWKCAEEFDVTPMLGVISLSLPTIIERIERGRAMGYRQFQISLPAWGELNDRELDLFFAETCDRFPDCRFLHYNLVRARRVLTSVEYKRLTAAHPNFVAVKGGARDPEIVKDLLSVSPRLRFYFTEFAYTIARQTHDVGLLISLATINYEKAKAFVSGDNARRAADMADLEIVLSSLRELSTGRFHIDGGFDKMLHRVNDSGFPLRLLPPYSYATEDEFSRFKASIPETWAH